MILRVALDVPLPKLFDYRAEDATRADIGYRVLVPFGTKRLVGLVVELAAGSDIPAKRLRSAEKILREVPPLGRAWLDLVKFCSGYYQRPLGEVVGAALPPRLRSVRPFAEAPRDFALAPAGREVLATLPARQRRMRALLARLSQGPASESELAAQTRGARRLIKRCIEEGWIAPVVPECPVPGFVRAYDLTTEQEEALHKLRRGLERFGVSLLFGVTGSGKTEIYLQLIAEVLARGKQALILVPEIALTPTLEAAFRYRFPGAGIVTQTSASPELERAHGWVLAHRGRAHIVLGTRLAVFASLPDLGLIVVDEEQDISFKQREGVRYSARDLAIARAQIAGVPVVLCSATPSLESFHRASSGKYELISLTRRAIHEAVMPAIRLIDTRVHPVHEGLATPLREAIATRLARGEQSLVFLNRRGYAPTLACPACGWVKGCTRCSAHMVVHSADRSLRCHHCGLAERVPRVCPECGNPDLQAFGRGTQRVELSLRDLFPQAQVLRLDSDAVRARSRIDDLLERAAQADILVGTQILAKGHHFERLTLVGVLNADSGIFSSDYRASERSFAQLQQVAGRAGRASLPGEVLIQTRYPGHPLYQALVRHDYPGFANSVLAERREAGFPPFVFEAVLRAESSDAMRAMRFLREAIEAAPRQRSEISLFDPAPMSLARVAGVERAQALLQSRSRPRLQAFLSEWSETLYRLPAQGVRWHLDVDPIEF
ncbi:MAG TPA: primosomal protein N' [Burkholderiales bacterium]|nr:primosomal protein N' [Burkholderiales bacterium]